MCILPFGKGAPCAHSNSLLERSTFVLQAKHNFQQLTFFFCQEKQLPSKVGKSLYIAIQQLFRQLFRLLLLLLGSLSTFCGKLVNGGCTLLLAGNVFTALANLVIWIR